MLGRTEMCAGCFSLQSKYKTCGQNIDAFCRDTLKRYVQSGNERKFTVQSFHPESFLNFQLMQGFGNTENLLDPTQPSKQNVFNWPISLPYYFFFNSLHSCCGIK